MELVSDETRTLRRTMRDLVALSALPAVWAGYQPPQVAEGLADVLLRALRLDLVYIRLPGQTEGQEIEVARTAGESTLTNQTRDIGRALASWLDGAAIDSAPLIPNPVGPGMVRVVVVPIGCGRQDGVLVAGSQQTAFPSEADRLLLSVGANQAAAVLQRERDEEALRESNKRFRIVTMATNDAVWDWDLNTNKVWWNEGVLTLFGYHLETNEADPGWWLERIHPDDREAVEAYLFEVVRGKELSWVDEYRFRCADGSYKDVHDRGYILRDTHGRATRMIGAMLDVSERKRAEEALRESEHRWQSLTEALPQLVWTATPDGTCDYFSTQWTQYSGVPESDLLGWRWLEVLHPDDRERTRQAWTAAVQGPGTYDVEYRVRRSDGAYRWFKTRGVPIRDSGGNIVKWFGTCTDITELRQTQEALRASEERFRGSFENAAIGIAHVDTMTGRFLRLNEKYCTIVGYPHDELIQKTVHDITHPGDVGKCSAATRPAFTLEKRYLRKDSSTVWVELSVSLQLDAAGKPAYCISVIQDISERKRLEAELRQAKELAEAANRAKDEFLANVSHEIRTPMNAILGMTELVLDTTLTDDQQQCLRTVKSAADNLLGIINDLLDFSKIEAGKLELAPADFFLRAAVGDTLRALAVRAHKKGLELVCQVHPEVPDALVGDAGRLRQVLLNLVGNALKFTDEGEVVVRVEAAGDPAPEGEVRLRFAVRDTGIGIPQDKQERIFRAFEQEDTSSTRKYCGTGLGLTIAARLVALMGGQLSVDSAPGRGSTFAFTARFERQPHSPEPVAARPPVLLYNLPVLIVDDNATNRRILEEWLRGWQMEPVAVGDGLAAMDALWHRAANGRSYALVLLDARMPGTDGLTLAATIRERAELSAARIILLTSGDRPGDLARFRELRIDAHLLKPVQQDELLETIYQVMSKAKDDAPTVAQSAPARDPGSAPVPAAIPLHILVAEDNEFSARLLEHLLTRRGHHVRLASNGREALALADDGAFDLLLLDVHMPELDGFQVVQALRERERIAGGHLPVIALTARSRKEDRERCLAAGMDDFLTKPVPTAGLFAAIDRLVSSPGVSRPTHMDVGGRRSLLDPVAVLRACGNDSDGLRRMCEDFKTYMPARLAEVGGAVRAKDAPRLRQAAHKICALLSAFSTVAGNAASDLEDRAAQHLLEEAGPLVRQLETMAQELLRLVGGLSLETLRHQAVITDDP